MADPAPTRQLDTPPAPQDAAELALLRELIDEVKALREEVRRLRLGSLQ